MPLSPTSVIIPAFNAARTLPNAVASVRRQAREAIEVIVVDDGSTDDTRACCERLGADIRYIRQENAGVAAARNVGVHAATGTRLTFLDADDEWTNESLSLLDVALDEHPEWMAVQGRTAAFVADLDGPVHDGTSFGAAWFGPTLGSTLFRRDAFDRVGTFDVKLRMAEDLDWFIRARECDAVVGQIERTTLHYRLHAGSLTRGLDPVNKNLMLVLKRSLDRRREAGRLPASSSRTSASPVTYS